MMGEHITLWDKIGNEMIFIHADETIENVEPVPLEEVARIAALPGARIERYDTDPPQDDAGESDEEF